MKEIKYKGKYLEMSEENIGGHIYERVKLRAGVAVIPVKGDKILFIREYRKHEGKSKIRLVSGWMDKEGFSSLQVAKEELSEEVNMKAEKWELFYTSGIVNGTVESQIDYFIAEDISKTEQEVQNPDGDVVEEIFWMTEKEYMEKIEKREIEWSEKSTVAMMAYRKINKK